MRWENLTPPDFKKLAAKEQICILPIGSLERHGDHMPFGTDTLTVHNLACRAAELEPCVVFPPYWFGQVHEAACHAGAINFPSRLALEMLEVLCDQIAHNGFKKIVIINGHGGNEHMLKYFAMSNLDKHVDYTLYVILSFTDIHGKNQKALGDICPSRPQGHACEWETSLAMAAAPGTVKLEYQHCSEPILPMGRFAKLRDMGVHSGMWWYADYPENIVGWPSLATREKGEQLLEAYGKDFAVVLKAIKEDTVLPQLQQEFYKRHAAVRNNK